MISREGSEPKDLCESSVGDRASGIFFLLLAAGAFFLAWGGVLDLPKEMNTFPLELVGSLFGAILLYQGLSVVFALKGFRVDPVAKTIRSFRRGAFGRRYGPEIALEDLDHVRYTLESRGTTSQKRVFQAVYLMTKSGEQTPVVRTDLFNYARSMAERFARELNLDLHDDSDGGEALVRSPEELDETVRERLGKKFSLRSQPSVPFAMRAKIDHGIDGLTIEIPRFEIGELGPMQKALWILMIALAGGIAAAYRWELSGVALFCVPVFLVFAYMLLRSETIRISGDSLSVRVGVGALKVKKTIPLSELEELHLSNLTAAEERDLGQLVNSGEVPRNLQGAIQAIVSLGSAIIAKSDRKKITMGRMLSNAELDVVLYEMERRIRG